MTDTARCPGCGHPLDQARLGVPRLWLHWYDRWSRCDKECRHGDQVLMRDANGILRIRAADGRHPVEVERTLHGDFVKRDGSASDTWQGPILMCAACAKEDSDGE